MYVAVKALALVGVAFSFIAATPAVPQINPAWRWAIDKTPTPAVTETGIDPSLHPEIVRVDCDETRGSAVKIGPRILLSVAHVTDGDNCKINGLPITVLGKKDDFSIISIESEPFDRWLKIDCGGFVGGRKYTAIGFARGLPYQTTVDVQSMGDRIWGFDRLWGVFTVIPGMSGGAFIDSETGNMVGMVNVYDARVGHSGSIPLKVTSICRS